MDDKDLAIECIPSEGRDDPKAKKLHPLVIKPPFCYLLVGSPGTGKSSLIWTMASKWYKGYFDLIVIYNGVKDADQAFQSLESKTCKVIVKNEWEPKQFSTFLTTLENENIELDKEKKRRRNVLLIFDDMVTQQITKASTVSILDRAIVNRRHMNLSIIVSTQSYKMVNRNLRALNSNAIFITGANKNDIQMICEEHTTPYHDEKDVMEFYKKAVEKKYSFFLINYRQPFHKRFWQNLDNCLSDSLEQ